MKTLKIDMIPAREAKTIYTVELEKAEIVVIKTALKMYWEDRIGFMEAFGSNIDLTADAWIKLAKEIESNLPHTGE